MIIPTLSPRLKVAVFAGLLFILALVFAPLLVQGKPDTTTVDSLNEVLVDPGDARFPSAKVPKRTAR